MAVELSKEHLPLGVSMVQPKGRKLPLVLVLLTLLNTLLLAYLLFAPALAGFFRTVTPPPGKEQQLSAYVASIRHDPLALRMLLRDFPKGADLHSHLSGAVYAESYLAWALESRLCVYVELHFLNNLPDCAQSSDVRYKDYTNTLLATQLAAQPDYRYRLIDAFSIRNHVQSHGAPSGADQFFASFDKFGAATTGREAAMLAEVLNRAGDQNISYLEIMMFPGSGDFLGLGAALDWNDDFAAMVTALEAAGFSALLEEKNRALNGILQDTRTLMGCESSNPQPGCQVELRLLAQALRNFPNDGQVFALMLACFRLADLNEQVVGVNFVMREDGEYSLARYSSHMAMMKYFKDSFPAVNLSLHAGELTLGLVPPAELYNHIAQALASGATRIGHGIDIAFEQDARQVLASMAERGILVEINLSSNDNILGVRGADHPFMTYRNSGVPVALSTDDEGVLRIDLTHEYVRAVLEYQLDYTDLKQLARNALAYSFLPAADKQRLAQRLEQAFRDFEDKWQAPATP